MLGRAINDKEKIPFWNRKKYQSVNGIPYTKKWQEFILSDKEQSIYERLLAGRGVAELCPF